MTTQLPYPHTRNDYVACREHDADVQLIEEPAQPAHIRPTLLCQRCLGRILTMQVIHGAGDDLTAPSTFTLVVAPARRLA
ncbi:hypothetical protein [Kribbella sp. NPDC048928]|uniref:hypothetical protein n=1 Tax=Kribbella sp. NPDC048928 TaxID=3364111 RepID=UPI00371E138C